ncbi:hypothetical protein LSH36_178g00031 [Paralvinella palmiformis]|uniref:DUF1907 domain-containing protein n=1 Tax=Paralvinella palmiformis TaxID=53620 RepID=A0AAD9JRS0_9ANNE|nr:hypothetical protein LSH36_178g00031 [Paralvinella palmiformis]
MDNSVPVVKIQLHVPLLEEVAKVLKDGLSKNFSEVSVSVVDCPDLTKDPFMLAEKGLCGSPRLAEIGAVSYLLPEVKRDKKYNLDQIASLSELPAGFMIGAGAGPADVLGFCCELMPNLKADNGRNNTHYCKVVPEVCWIYDQ